MKALILTDTRGRLLFCGETRPGSCADITQARRAGLVDLLTDTIHLWILADAGYQGLGGQDRSSPRPASDVASTSNTCNG